MFDTRYTRRKQLISGATLLHSKFFSYICIRYYYLSDKVSLTFHHNKMIIKPISVVFLSFHYPPSHTCKLDNDVNNTNDAITPKSATCFFEGYSIYFWRLWTNMADNKKSKSAVWNYFELNDSKTRTICQLCKTSLGYTCMYIYLL